LANPRIATTRSRSSAALAPAADHRRKLAAVDVTNGAQTLDHPAFLRRGDDPNRVGARRAADLGGKDAEAPGRSPDQDVLPGLQIALLDQHPV
jgi:hypothetical protein